MANEYNPVSGLYTEQIASTHDVFKPQHEVELKSQFGNQFMASQTWLRAMSREKPVAGDQLTTHEDDWIHKEINVDGAPSVTATDKILVTLAAGDHDSKGNSYPRVGQIVMTASELPARITAKDETTPTAHILTLESVDEDDDISADVSDGDVLIINNAAYGAGTGQPEGTVSGTRQFTFDAQIFKETVGAEGSQLVNERWYKMPDKNGNASWFSPDSVTRAEALLDLQIEGAFAFGKENNNADLVVPSGEAGAGNLIRTTKGLVPHIRSRGKTISITSGAFDLTDLDEVYTYLLSQGVTSGYAMILSGARLGIDIRDAAFDKLDGNGTDYTAAAQKLFGSGADAGDLAMAMNFKVIKFNNITFIIKTMDHWSNPKTYGATGFNFDQYGIVIPLTQFVSPKDNTVWDNLTVRYRAKGNYSRRMEIWRNGAAGGDKQYIGDVDRTNTWIRAHLMFQANKMNQGVLMDPA